MEHVMKALSYKEMNLVTGGDTMRSVAAQLLIDKLGGPFLDPVIAPLTAEMRKLGAAAGEYLCAKGEELSSKFNVDLDDKRFVSFGVAVIGISILACTKETIKQALR